MKNKLKVSAVQNDNWFAIVNPQSANGITRKRWPEYLSQLREDGNQIDFEYTTGTGDATRITQRVLMEGYLHIIAVGGDGTMNEVLNGFFANGQPLNPDAELAIFSHGTGGDLIRSLKITRGIESFLKILRRGQKRQIDVGEVTFEDKHGYQTQRYFLNVADIGLGGETVARVNKQSKFLGGKLSFLIGSVLSILQYRNKVMSCEIDANVILEGRLNSIMVCNGRFFGGGMMIAPHAELDDGLFDVVCLGDFSTLMLLRHLPKLYKGTHLEIPGVTVYRGQSVVITTVETALLDIDGEQPGQAPLTFTMHPKALCLWG